MTYELNLKCIWQHPTTGNHLQITIIVWGEVKKPIIITVRSLRQAQPGTWKIPIKPDTEDWINLLSSLIDLTKFPLLCSSSSITKASGERAYSLLSVTNSRRTIQFETS